MDGSAIGREKTFAEAEPLLYPITDISQFKLNQKSLTFATGIMLPLPNFNI
jgi:hypothetical protein